MTTRTNKERLIASTLLAGVASLGAPFLAAGVVATTATDAMAQDYTNGSLIGTIEDENGAPVAGATVTVTSDAQGFSRTLTTDANGQFRIALLPLGSYTVLAQGDGYAPTQSTIRISSGESAYAIALTSSAGGDDIIVTAARQSLDFSETTIGASFDLDELTNQVPVGRTLRDVTLLAPGVVLGGSTGDATFAGQPVIGGASVAENAFYVNGLNITNFNTYIGGALVPFDFYRSVEVKSGGYAAEFGRATGGVINTVTKSGSNDFTFSVSGNWAGPELENESPDTFQAANHHDETLVQDLTFEVGGPIWRDHIFFYGLAQLRDNEARQASTLTGSYLIDRTDDPFYGAKLDFNVTDRQRLEFTWFDTTRETNRAVYDYDTATDTIGNDEVGAILFQDGGESWVGRYTGEFSDFFTLSGAYGISNDSDSTIPNNPGNPVVVDERDPAAPIISAQTSGSTDIVETEREFYRVDADFYFDLFGEHHVRVGYDNEINTLTHFQNSTGGAVYTYFSATAADALLYGIPEGSDYLELRVFNVGGIFEAENEAFYAQDSWNITDDLTLNLGVRVDHFRGSNSDGEEYIALEDNVAPRIGFSWNPDGGDGRWFGNYGRYYLPVASNTAFRNAGSATDFEAYFTFAGPLDPVTALPASTTLLTGWEEASECIAGMPIAGVTGEVACNIFSSGQAIPTDSFVSQSLEATAEDEYILGYEQQIGDWTWRITGIYRDVVRTQEDVAIDRAVRTWCADNGYAATIAGPDQGCNEIWNGFHQYVLHNPGEDMTVFLSDPLPGETERRAITLTADQLLYPRAEREYKAVEFAFERNFDGRWSLAGSYTLSESEGNYEGFVNSDVGQDDAGITIGFDTPALTDGAFGLLPNHRAHQLKLYGSYQLTEHLLVGANYTLTSPKHYGCFGVHPISFAATGDPASFYENVSNYCNGQLVPRGSAFSGDWVNSVDIAFRYDLGAVVGAPGNLQLRADIFNLFNAEGVTQHWEFGELSNGAPDPNYGSPVVYQQPRFVRLGFGWQF
jgi:outer membrane receptor protein involved in Fe transport